MPQVIIQRNVLIDAPLTHVWQLVATENGLRQWWGNTISLEAREGGTCEEWRNERNSSSHWKGVVTIYTPPHQLMLTLKAQEVEEGRPELSTISIALEAAGELTRVHVTQRAFGATAAIGTLLSETPQPMGPAKQPANPRLAPRAQLDRVAPGSLPMPVAISTVAAGRIERAQLVVTHEHVDELEQWWQRRFTSLTAASHRAMAG